MRGMIRRTKTPTPISLGLGARPRLWSTRHSSYTFLCGFANVPVPGPEAELRSYYRSLYHAWGAQHWWPARTRFEMIVGAYLTQKTAWTNVERALANLRAAQLLSIRGIRRVPLQELEKLIRPSGYFRQKATRLKTFVTFLD